MKKVLGIVALVLIVYAIYSDITTGTLIGKSSEEIVETSLSIQYIEVQVKPGDTLLSLIEQQGGYPDQVSINQMIDDFISLNEGMKPNDMQPGKVYKIPIYQHANN
ncbi:hypothetical protein [Bacillus andreraoultii]|uniref:hypothetical protein n=1 Tax=Bacillus andreraoultii TaxID=1499685 RepID=UPI00053B1633|nr:hypothetical protein [Bacillus andreraoultii]